MSYQELADALVKGKVDTVVQIVDKAINVENKAPQDVIENGLAPGMDQLGDLYDKGDAFLVDLVVAAEAFKKCMDLMKPKLQVGAHQIGTVVIGTISGDIHDLGKNLAKARYAVPCIREISEVNRDKFVTQFDAVDSDPFRHNWHSNLQRPLAIDSLREGWYTPRSSENHFLSHPVFKTS